MRVVLTSIAAGLLAGAAAAWIASCSLGEAYTPKCDPQAGPTDPSACWPVAACDDGHGGIKPQQQCCHDYANRNFKICVNDAAQDYDKNCSGTAGCCGTAQKQYDDCMAGKKLSSGGPGGGGGGAGGGGGGAGSAGGAGGAGGAAGGSGGSGG
ncbi:MAG: hypothetical protein HY744_25075 [Deltaproteobacteria bacterium]|nr:hypothetical protein [Deltaproteobacteria bacterium]